MRSRFAISGGMAYGRPSASYDRVLERRRAVALARHFRETEGLSIAQIGERLGHCPATVKASFYGPTGEKARCQGALRRDMPRLRRLHPASQRQGRPYRYQGSSSRRDRPMLDVGVGARGDGGGRIATHAARCSDSADPIRTARAIADRRRSPFVCPARRSSTCGRTGSRPHKPRQTRSCEGQRPTHPPRTGRLRAGARP